MAHTNSTTNYELSQFQGSDKPAWLVDYNGDMLKIDNALKGIADAESASSEDIQALQDAIGAEGLTGRITNIENDIGDIKTEIGSVELPTTAQSLTGAIAELKGVNDNQNQAINQNSDTIAQVGGAVEGVSQLAYTIANVYDSSATYAVGAYAIYQNTLYKCITAINVGEPFDASKWTSVKVMSEVGQVGGAIDGVAQLAYTIANVYDSTATYAIGDYAIYQNTLYKCTTAINVGETFDPAKWTSVKVMSEVDNSLPNFMISNSSNYVDLNTSVPYNSSYTAPADGYYFFLMSTSASGMNAVLYLDSNRTISLLQTNGSLETFIPLKSGTTVYTRDASQTSYTIKGYIPL